MKAAAARGMVQAAVAGNDDERDGGGVDGHFLHRFCGVFMIVSVLF